MKKIKLSLIVVTLTSCAFLSKASVIIKSPCENSVNFDSHNVITPDSTFKVYYLCPKCNCGKDSFHFKASGSCPACGMKLTKVGIGKVRRI